MSPGCTIDDPTAEDDVEVLTNENNCPIPYAAIRKATDGENYTMSLVGDDARVVINAVNIGIDSALIYLLHHAGFLQKCTIFPYTIPRWG
jgi:hypothetical protein